MTYYEAKELNDAYLTGEKAGRQDAARRWGKRDTSNESFAYHQGYSDGYESDARYN